MGQPNVDIVIDCHGIEALIDFWAAALGYRNIGIKDNYGLLLPDDPSHPPVLLQRVPEPKTSKTRVHFDIRVDDVEAKAKELEALGARRIDVGQSADANFIPMADPEGTEFCVCPRPPHLGKPDRRQIGLRDRGAVEGDVYAGDAVQCGCSAGGGEMPGVVGCSEIASPEPSEVVTQHAGRMEGGVPTEGTEVPRTPTEGTAGSPTRTGATASWHLSRTPSSRRPTSPHRRPRGGHLLRVWRHSARRRRAWGAGRLHPIRRRPAWCRHLGHHRSRPDLSHRSARSRVTLSTSRSTSRRARLRGPRGGPERRCRGRRRGRPTTNRLWR